MNQQITMQFGRNHEWSNFRVGDLRESLRSLLVMTLEGAVDQEKIDYWRDKCDAQIDFLVYSLACAEGASDDPSNEIDELVTQWSNRSLTLTSRVNLLPIYLSTYFFKYISSVELPKLQVALSNPQLTQIQCIDFYITQALYGAVVEENPGVFFTYEQIPGIGANRIAALRQIRADLVESLDQIGAHRLPALIDSLRDQSAEISNNDIEKLIPVFKSLFLLMTYYVGSSYRRVHDAVTTLLSVDMADFRNIFFQHLSSIIRHRGGLLPQISVEATNTEEKTYSGPSRMSATDASSSGRPSALLPAAVSIAILALIIAFALAS